MLLDLANAVEDIRCEYLGDVEALLHEVEVSPSLVWLEGRLIGPGPGAGWRYGLDHGTEPTAKSRRCPARTESTMEQLCLPSLS